MSLGTESFGLFSCIINGEERDQTHKAVYRWNGLTHHYQRAQHTCVTVDAFVFFLDDHAIDQSPEWMHGQWILGHSQEMAPFVTQKFQDF